MPITLKVKDIMDTKVHSLDAGATVAKAIKSMVENKVWSLIVEKRGLPEGVVTERDVLRRCLAKGLDPAKTSVGSIASSPVISIGPEATIRDAMDLMAAKDIRRLFVVEKGKIIGRVTQTELFQSTLSVMETLSSLSDAL
ncbi:MAG: CBS domain-containing protein [Thaumarchaeota archaeon]|nr:CBS domain-containing protein [Nitrososphaerota archaeon]